MHTVMLMRVMLMVLLFGAAALTLATCSPVPKRNGAIEDESKLQHKLYLMPTPDRAKSQAEPHKMETSDEKKRNMPMDVHVINKRAEGRTEGRKLMASAKKIAEPKGQVGRNHGQSVSQGQSVGKEAKGLHNEILMSDLEQKLMEKLAPHAESTKANARMEKTNDVSNGAHDDLVSAILDILGVDPRNSNDELLNDLDNILITAELLSAKDDNSLNHLQEQYNIRLVNGPDSASGRVEVYYGGFWGTVCDDYFDMKDADVVCRQLGYQAATGYYGNAHFGEGAGLILLDDLDCSGNESQVTFCHHLGFGNHNCNHSEDVGVVCSDSKM